MFFSETFYIILDITSFLSIFPCNIFILLVNFLDWKKKRTLQISDAIITGISVSNLIYGVIKLLRFLTNHYNLIAIKKIAVTVNLITISCNIWFSTWLCVHFCLKIVKLHQSFYIYLQRTFHRNLSCLLVLSVVVSVLISFYVILDSSNEWLFDTELRSSMKNVSQNLWSIQEEEHISFYLHFTISLLAVVLLTCSSLTIVYTLCRHIYILKNNSEGFQSSTTAAHIRATIIVVSLYILCLMLFVNVTMMAVRISEQQWPHIVISLHYVCGVLSYVGLIKGNSKLDKALRDVMNWFKCSQSSM